jgi:hypothetical protein
MLTNSQMDKVCDPQLSKWCDETGDVADERVNEKVKCVAAEENIPLVTLVFM